MIEERDMQIINMKQRQTNQLIRRNFIVMACLEVFTCFTYLTSIFFYLWVRVSPNGASASAIANASLNFAPNDSSSSSSGSSSIYLSILFVYVSAEVQGNGGDGGGGGAKFMLLNKYIQNNTFCDNLKASASSNRATLYAQCVNTFEALDYLGIGCTSLMGIGFLTSVVLLRRQFLRYRGVRAQKRRFSTSCLHVLNFVIYFIPVGCYALLNLAGNLMHVKFQVMYWICFSCTVVYAFLIVYHRCCKSRLKENQIMGDLLHEVSEHMAARSGRELETYQDVRNSSSAYRDSETEVVPQKGVPPVHARINEDLEKSLPPNSLDAPQ